MNEWLEAYKAGNPHHNYGPHTALSMGQHLKQLKIHGTFGEVLGCVFYN